MSNGCESNFRLRTENAHHQDTKNTKDHKEDIRSFFLVSLGVLCVFVVLLPFNPKSEIRNSFHLPSGTDVGVAFFASVSFARLASIDLAASTTSAGTSLMAFHCSA